MFTLDLDKFLADLPAPADPDRLFAFDLFVSHRNYDSPVGLISALEREGVKVTWDRGLDLRDRRVIHAVDREMSQSRSLALYVSSTYEESLWCRAEYLSALHIGKRANAPVVLTLIESEAARKKLPPDLRCAETYTVSPEGLATLAKILRARNKRMDNPISKFLRTNGWLTVDTKLLARSEQLKLLRERLEFWVEHSDDLTNMSSKEMKVKILTIFMGEPLTELEIILREAAGIVTLPSPSSRPRFAPGLCDADWQVFVDLAELTSRAAMPHLSHFWKASEEWLWDFLLKPLVGAIQREETAKRAAAAYHLICEQIRSEPKLRLYLDVLQEVSSGASCADKYWTRFEVRLYRAHEESRKPVGRINRQ